MKIEDCKVGMRIQRYHWNENDFVTIVFVGTNLIVARTSENEEFPAYSHDVRGFHPYTPPKKKVRKAQAIYDHGGESPALSSTLFESYEGAKIVFGSQLIDFPAKREDGSEIWFSVPE